MKPREEYPTPPRDLEALLFGNAGNGSLVGDAAGTATYAAVRRAAGLGEVLGEPRVRRAQCVCVALQNDVNHVTLLLALLTRGINVFLRSGSVAAPAAVPGFCDLILALRDKDGSPEALAAGVEVRENPGFVPGAEAIPPASGRVLFATSGTTGKAKYVCYQSHALLRNARKCAVRFGLGPRCRVLVPVPVHHMYGLGAGLLPALVAGADVCLIEKNNVIKLYDQLVRFRPDVALVNPTVCKMLLLLGKKIPGGTLFITGGDRVTREVHQDFEARYGWLVNLYGCTEMGAVAASGPHPGAGPEGTVVPLDGVALEIGGPGQGELLCRHDAGFEGYVDEAGNRTGDGNGPGAWYKTRDLGVRAGPGAFRVIGRTDHCLNRNGFLVSLREVELTLDELFKEDLRQVILLAGSRETVMGSVLVAVCELREDARLSGEAIRTGCKAKLPGHQVPDEYYLVREIPTLSNGKPDRSLLAATYAATRNLNELYPNCIPT